MSDRIGVLGSAATAALGATTVYQAPVGKAAKVKFFFLMQAGAGGTTTLQVLVNGLSVMQSAALAASNYIFSARSGGLTVAPQAALPTGLTNVATPAPADQVYFLSPGQSLSYVIGGAAAISMNAQVVGTEIDV